MIPCSQSYTSRLYRGYIGVIMENQMEKKMEHEMETGIKGVH